MSGAAKKIGGAVGTALTLGTNKIKGSPTAKLGDAFGSIATGGLSGQQNSLLRRPGGDVMSAGGAENPAQTLAQSGGAPLLANIAMGANVGDTIAGYFGHNDYNKFYESLGPLDRELVDGVNKQLTDIQKNTNLRNQAVQQIIDDFPNIANQALERQKQAFSKAEGAFDEADRLSLDKASNQLAAKYAASGGFNSGAFNQGLANTAGETARMRGQNSFDNQMTLANNRYQNDFMGAQLRLGETQALRNFQNLMLQGTAGNGFSAAQNALQRAQQTNLTNAGFANQQNLQNQQNDNAMFGAIGGLAGTALGGFLGGPMGAAAGGRMGSEMTGSFSNTPESAGQNSRQYAPPRLRMPSTGGY